MNTVHHIIVAYI